MIFAIYIVNHGNKLRGRFSTDLREIAGFLQIRRKLFFIRSAVLLALLNTVKLVVVLRMKKIVFT